MSPQKRIKGDGLRQRAERLLSEKPRARRKIPPEDRERLIHELEVHQIELEMQNEELRKAQVEIEESHRKYVDLYEFSPVGYFTLTETGKIMEVNLTGASLLGQERGQLLQRAFSSFVAPDFRAAFRDHCQAVLRKEKRERCELKLIKREGVPFYASLESVAVSDKNGKSLIRSALSDLTDRKRAEEEVLRLNAELEQRVKERTSQLEATNERLQIEIAERRQAEEALRQSDQRERQRAAELAVVLDAVPAAVWIAQDPDCSHITGNRAGDEVLQLSRGAESSLTAAASTRPTHFRVVKDGRQLADEELPVQRAARGTTLQDVEFTLVFDDGTVRHMLGNATPLRDEQGQARGAVAAFVDVTRRKQAEEALAERTVQLERTNRELVATNAELEEFTHVASHDLQEPLRTLTAFSDFLRKDLDLPLPAKAAQDLGFITDAAKRMQTLIQDLLALSRAGRVAKKREKVSLGECADQALEALAIRVKETGAKITREKLPEVWGDSTLLKQLYQNLIGNALKFTGEQPPVIRLTAEEREGSLVFGVKDNGIGIDTRYAQQVFQPFRRLHARTDYEGSGIGLAICRKIAERHGGKIWVESEPGKGAHFRFTISHRGRER
jgi:PAS domain S-box-containing protein